MIGQFWCAWPPMNTIISQFWQRFLHQMFTTAPCPRDGLSLLDRNWLINGPLKLKVQQFWHNLWGVRYKYCDEWYNLYRLNLSWVIEKVFSMKMMRCEFTSWSKHAGLSLLILFHVESSFQSGVFTNSSSKIKNIFRNTIFSQNNLIVNHTTRAIKTVQLQML